MPRVLTLGNRVMEHEAKRLRTILVPRGAEVYRDSNQSIPSGDWTAISFNQERFDDGYWAAANPTRLTVPSGWEGRHIMYGHIRWDANAGGSVRGICIAMNATTTIAMNTWPPPGTAQTAQTVGTEYPLSSGDYVELYVLQDTGSPLNVLTSAKYGIEFRIIKV